MTNLFSFALSENYITLHEHPVRINAVKVTLGTFTWDSVMDAFVFLKDRESVVSFLNTRTSEKNLCFSY